MSFLDRVELLDAVSAELVQLEDEAQADGRLNGLQAYIVGWMVAADPEEARKCFVEFRAMRARVDAQLAADRPTG